MDAIEFVIRYPDYISQLEAVVKPEPLPAIEKLRALDPHDIVRPNCFASYFFISYLADEGPDYITKTTCHEKSLLIHNSFIHFINGSG